MGTLDGGSQGHFIDVSSDAESSLQPHTTSQRVIVAGSVQTLVDALLTKNGNLDSAHFNVFFNTYRTFLQPIEVLELLLDIYRSEDRNMCDPTAGRNYAHAVRCSISTIIGLWMDKFPEDFGMLHEAKKCPAETVLDFAAQNMMYFEEIYTKASRIYKDVLHRHRKGSLTQVWTHRKLGLVSAQGSLDYILDGHTPRLPDFVQMDEGYIADQLTYWDCELFKRLIPYQCLAKFWNRRHKYDVSVHDPVYTVRATVNQFNIISGRVASMILAQPDNEPSSLVAAAKILAKWIDVLHELRVRQNYSSLRAVVSVIQSEPIYRLSNVWARIPKSKSKSLQEFCEQHLNEENLCRSASAKKTTMRSAPLNRVLTAANQNLRHRNATRSKSDIFQMQGVVPYLGSFLTDLVHIDAACSSKTEDGLVNFSKCQKEFEVLSQIKLFQSAAQAYHISCDPKFKSWFSQQPAHCESHWMRLSLQLQPSNRNQEVESSTRPLRAWTSLTHLITDGEPLTPTYTNDNHKENKHGLLHSSIIKRAESTKMSHAAWKKKPRNRNYTWAASASSPIGMNQNARPILTGNKGNESLGSPVFGSLGSWLRQRKRERRQRNYSNRSWGSESIHSTKSISTPRRSNDSNSGVSCSGDQEDIEPEGHAESHQHRPTSVCFDNFKSDSQSDSLPNSVGNSAKAAPPQLLVRVSLAPEVQAQSPLVSFYKCIHVNNCDKTETVIAKALAKHKVRGDPNGYELVQWCNNAKTLVIPAKANAYYAIFQGDGLENIQCIVNKKKAITDEASFGKIEWNVRKISLPAKLLRWNSTQ